MNRITPVAVALAAATAVAASGCASTVAGVPVASGDLKAAEIATETTTHTAAMPPVQESRWVTPPWQGKVNSDNVGAQFGPAAPGVVISQHQPDGSSKDCTVGPAVVGGVLTAGHCDKASGGEVFVFLTAEGGPDSAGFYRGTKKPEVDSEGRPVPEDGVVRDFTELLTDTAPGVTRIAGHYPVAGVLTVEATRSLEPDTPICVDGAVTGVSCGPLLNADEGGLMSIGVETDHGDSGGPVFVVDRQGRAALAGLVYGGDGPDTAATYLEPALRRIGAKALLDSQVEPLAGNVFNVAVTAG